MRMLLVVLAVCLCFYAYSAAGILTAGKASLANTMTKRAAMLNGI